MKIKANNKSSKKKNNNNKKQLLKTWSLFCVSQLFLDMYMAFPRVWLPNTE